MSGRFGDEEALTGAVMTRLEANSGEEFLLTLVAITFVIGIFATIHYFSEIAFLSKIIVNIIEELPRIIYLFGANLAAVSLMIGFYLSKNPDGATEPARFYSLAAFFGVSMFVYGFLLRFIIQKKSHGFRKKST